MITKVTTKAIALGGVSFLVAGGIAIGVETTKGLLFEIRNSLAAIEEAKASNKAADAKTLEAINGLKGTENAANAVVIAAQTEAAATRAAAQQNAAAAITAAQKQADALISATTESVRAENTQFDEVTRPLFAEPTERMAKLNTEIVRLKHELATGQSANSPFAMLPAGRTEKADTLATREGELQMLKDTTAKNMSDAMGMIMGVVGGGLGDMGKLYPNGNEPVPVRRILEEDRDGRIRIK